MAISRRVEFASGLVAGVIGLASVGLIFFGPVVRESGEQTTYADGVAHTTPYDRLTSIIASQGLGAVLPHILGLSLIVIAIALGAWWHSVYNFAGGRVILWLATTLLIVGAVITGFSIGFFLLPTVAAALVAVIAAASNQTPGN